MKELNIIQAMEMPVGTKFNFHTETEKEAEFIEILEGNADPKILCWNGNRDLRVRVCTSTAKMKLTPIQKPVSFMEAIKASQEGKVIRVDIENKTFTYHPRNFT